MAKAKAKTSLAPIQKTHPDRIKEDENLEKYQEIAEKMVNASDEIIDRVLDRLEGKPTAPVKPVAAKKEQTPKAATEPAAQPQVQEETPPPSIEPDPLERAYIQLEQDFNRVKAEKNELEMLLEEEKMNSKKLQDEIANLKDQVDKLTNELQDYRAGGERSPFKAEVNELVKKNDDLLLKNSELEFEISRLSAERQNLKQKLEQLENQRRLPPQTPHKESYTRAPQVRRPVIGANGYEFWN